MRRAPASPGELPRCAEVVRTLPLGLEYGPNSGGARGVHVADVGGHTDWGRGNSCDFRVSTRFAIGAHRLWTGFHHNPISVMSGLASSTLILDSADFYPLPTNNRQVLTEFGPTLTELQHVLTNFQHISAKLDGFWPGLDCARPCPVRLRQKHGPKSSKSSPSWSYLGQHRPNLSF